MNRIQSHDDHAAIPIELLMTAKLNRFHFIFGVFSMAAGSRSADLCV